MNFLIYDKHGIPVYGINVEPKVTGSGFQYMLDLFIRDFPDNLNEFNIKDFQLYIWSKWNLKSCEFTFDRINMREVRDARMD